MRSTCWPRSCSSARPSAPPSRRTASTTHRWRESRCRPGSSPDSARHIDGITSTAPEAALAAVAQHHLAMMQADAHMQRPQALARPLRSGTAPTPSAGRRPGIGASRGPGCGVPNVAGPSPRYLSRSLDGQTASSGGQTFTQQLVTWTLESWALSVVSRQTDEEHGHDLRAARSVAAICISSSTMLGEKKRQIARLRPPRRAGAGSLALGQVAQDRREQPALASAAARSPTARWE